MKTILNKWKSQAGLACLVLIAGTGVGLGQGTIFTFNNTSDATAWTDASQNVTVTSSFIAGDAPAGQSLSTGALGFNGTYGPSGPHDFGGLTITFPDIDVLDDYSGISFWVKNEGTLDQYGQIQGIQFNLSNYGTGLYQTSAVQPTYTGSGWEQFFIPTSAFSAAGAKLDDVNRINLYVYDGNYTANTPMNIAFDNIEFVPVPEPSSSLLLFLGVTALGLTTLCRKKLC